jgi:hypothetical protein
MLRRLQKGVLTHALAGDDIFEFIFNDPTSRKGSGQPDYRLYCEAYMMERTPSEFRNFYNEWRKTAPPNDSDIIPDKPRSTKAPKLADKLTFLKAMLAWREMQESRDPLQTNFLQSGTDDEILNDDGTVTFPERDVECEWEDRPTIKEMTNVLEGVVFKKSFDNVISHSEYGPTKYLRSRLVPDRYAPENYEPVEHWKDGKKGKRPRIEFEQYESMVFNEKGNARRETDKKGYLMWAITRLGTLLFSDAKSDEKYPRNSLLSWRPGKFGTPINEPGTPNGLSENFFPPPEIPRLNPLERLIAMEDAGAANDNLSPEHVMVLDTAMVAQNFTVVGEAFGFRGKTAERHGKRLVLEASKAFSDVLERLAA